MKAEIVSVGVKSPKAKSATVLQCFFGVDLRNGHTGLAELAKTRGIKVGSITPGSYVIFVNNSRTGAKVYAHRDIVAFYKPSRGRVDIDALRNIPAAFESDKMMNLGALRDKMISELRNVPSRRELKLVTKS